MNDILLGLVQSNPKNLPVRMKILRTAIILFNENGIHTTGIDRIIAESGVAKMSFYYNFPSKAKLISEYLSYKAELRFQSIKKHTVEKSDDPIKQLLGIFDSLEEWYLEKDFFGCPFIRGLYDFNERDAIDLRKQVKAEFKRISEFVEQRLLKIVSPRRAKKMLPQFLSLYAGSTVMALAESDPKIARANKEAARILLKFN